MNDGTFRRRDVLLVTLVAVLEPIRFAAADNADFLDKINELPNSILGTLADNSEAYQIGCEYLNANPDEADPEFLISATLGHAFQSMDGHAIDSELHAMQNFRRYHERDCSELDMVNVSGIILSRSEARLYGLSASLTMI